ncbi:MAG: hypothetical protein K6F28_07890 [Lachnospiraceae bacterium]|nr:hypothetical protein [Lachnospiraceae bacterium]
MKRPIAFILTIILTMSQSAMTAYGMEGVPLDSMASEEGAASDAAGIEEAGEYERVTEKL